MKKNVTLLDVDGTILDSALVIDFLGLLAPDNKYYLKWKKDKKNEELIDKCGAEFSKVIQNYTKEELQPYIKKLIKKQNINRYLKAYFKTTKIKTNILISGSPQFLINELCKELHSNYPELEFIGYGSTLEETENKYTGKYLIRLYLKNEKEKIVERLKQDYKIKCGFGDTFSDEPILRYAKRKFLIHPNSKTVFQYSLNTEFENKIIILN